MDIRRDEIAIKVAQHAIRRVVVNRQGCGNSREWKSSVSGVVPSLKGLRSGAYFSPSTYLLGYLNFVASGLLTSVISRSGSLAERQSRSDGVN